MSVHMAPHDKTLTVEITHVPSQNETLRSFSNMMLSKNLGRSSNVLYLHPNLGDMIQFDKHILQGVGSTTNYPKNLKTCSNSSNQIHLESWNPIHSIGVSMGP